MKMIRWIKSFFRQTNPVPLPPGWCMRNGLSIPPPEALADPQGYLNGKYNDVYPPIKLVDGQWVRA